MEKWTKSQRRLLTACHFTEDNISIHGVILNPVHIINFKKWSTNQEVDFYMDSGDDIFFLRLKNNNKLILLTMEKLYILLLKSL